MLCERQMRNMGGDRLLTMGMMTGTWARMLCSSWSEFPPHHRPRTRKGWLFPAHQVARKHCTGCWRNSLLRFSQIRNRDAYFARLTGRLSSSNAKLVVSTNGTSSWAIRSLMTSRNPAMSSELLDPTDTNVVSTPVAIPTAYCTSKL